MSPKLLGSTIFALENSTRIKLIIACCHKGYNEGELNYLHECKNSKAGLNFLQHNK